MTNLQFTGVIPHRKRATLKSGIEPRSAGLQADTLTTGPGHLDHWATGGHLDHWATGGHLDHWARTP